MNFKKSKQIITVIDGQVTQGKAQNKKLTKKQLVENRQREWDKNTLEAQYLSHFQTL